LSERVYVQVDGGIDHDTIGAARAAGATLLVAGAAIFGSGDLAQAYRGLVQGLA
jgi:ribulose-phosphate 3-epimerase